jgi:RimJ/RimL family protein N-acetyltransferase
MDRESFNAKSNYVAQALPSEGRAAMIAAAEASGSGALLCDAHGGAINRIAAHLVYPRDAYWPAAGRIDTRHLMLEPLRVEHADEMLLVLGDRDLYEYTGGEPPSLDELRARYARQVAGHSSDDAYGWLNWVVRERKNRVVVGTVQSTLVLEQGQPLAELGWIVAPAHQRHGVATEAAGAMLGWLGGHGVVAFVAHIHPGHAASTGLAMRLGLTATGVVVDGETRWVGSCHRQTLSGLGAGEAEAVRPSRRARVTR